MKKHSKPLMLWLMLLFLVSSCTQYPSRPQPPQYVNDFAGIFRLNQGQELESTLSHYYNSNRKAQIVVITVSSLKGREIDRYASDIANVWGMDDHNILLLFAPRERKVGVEVGKGLQAELPKLKVKKMIDTQIAPVFESKKYFQGVNAFCSAVIKDLGGELKEQGKLVEYRRVEFSFWDRNGRVIIIAGIILTVIIFVLYLSRRYFVTDNKSNHN
jgi:uncharacterized protein